MKYLMIPLLLLTGCGKAPNEIPTDFRALVDRFQQVAVQEGVQLDPSVSLKIEFSDEIPDKGGDCGFGAQNIVRINKSLWIRYAQYEGQQEALLFHELGHCWLGRLHNDLNNPSHPEDPISIMTSHALDATRYNRWKSDYLHELFHPEAYL